MLTLNQVAEVRTDETGLMKLRAEHAVRVKAENIAIAAACGYDVLTDAAADLVRTLEDVKPYLAD